MKTYSARCLLAFALLATLFVSKVQAQYFNPIVLVVDDSNASAVTITATGVDPGIASTNHTFSEGFELTQFFTSEAGPFSPIISVPVTVPGLSTYNQGTPLYNAARVDFSSGSPRDLNLYTTGSSASETFTPNTPAFVGTTTLDLSAFANLLPSNGIYYAVYAGYSQGANPIQIFGRFEVVPEPASRGLLLLGIVGLLGFRRLRQA